MTAGGDGQRPQPEERVVGGRFARAHHILLYFVGAVVAVWLLSGFYKVNIDQVAIVERLGQFIATDTGRVIPVHSGLHWHLPWPIDRVHVISVQQRLTMTVKSFNAAPAEYADFKRAYMNSKEFANIRPEAASAIVDALFNPYLITADKSVLHMEVSVQFQVTNPQQWLMAVSHEYQERYDPAVKEDLRNQLFEQIIERALIAQTARMTFDQLLLGNRESLPGTVQNFVAKGMKIETVNPADPTKRQEIDLGIDIVAVQVKLRPPDAVMGAYNNVLAQLAAADTKRSAAQAEHDTMLTKAKGDTQTLIVDAERYRTTTVQTAKGEAERFGNVLKQYEISPDVTRWNLYVDAATAVTANAKRIFVVRPGQDGPWIGVEAPQYDANQAKAGTQP
jgi:membrane protease subunit HflK